jgi:hypothetical protein
MSSLAFPYLLTVHERDNLNFRNRDKLSQQQENRPECQGSNATAETPNTIATTVIYRRRRSSVLGRKVSKTAASESSHVHTGRGQVPRLEA